MDHKPSIPKSTPTKNSLRQALRKILFKGRRISPEDVINTVGSGILRRDPSLCAIPTPKPSASSFQFDERFDLDDEPVIFGGFGSNGGSDNFDISSLASAVSVGHSLKPQLSMSSFRTGATPAIDHLPLISQSIPHRQTSVSWLDERKPSIYEPPSALPPRASSLRIQRSDQSLRRDHREHKPVLQSPRRGLMRKQSSIAEVVPQPSPVQQPTDATSQSSRSTFSSVRFAELPPPSRTPSLQSDTSREQPISHFSSFCILDTARPQCPVSATSHDLRYIFDIGEEFCLNNRGCEGTSMDMITGWDASGHPITHLVLFSPLVIPSSGRSRFMLASLVDVTDFIKDTASLPGLCTISEESATDEDIPTPKSTISRSRLRSKLTKPPRSGLTYALSAEDLLGGCFMADAQTPPLSILDDEDIWLDIAREEQRRSTGSRTPSVDSARLSSIDDVVSDFMNHLQELYSDFFMLAKSPFDPDFYEICNVSPRVYASKDYINGHLSRTATSDMEELSVQLGEDKAFTMLVRWGPHGLLKQLYCIPLFARSATTWACFLVDASLPPLWS